MESNEQTKLTSKIETIHRKQADSLGGGKLEVEGSSKKEKGLMDMDNCVVIVGGGGHKGNKW